MVWRQAVCFNACRDFDHSGGESVWGEGGESVLRRMGRAIKEEEMKESASGVAVVGGECVEIRRKGRVLEEERTGGEDGERGGEKKR